jgi:NAD(P)-dependent dehydrogenase (short-subunit alcohol dehydrogenase family)
VGGNGTLGKAIHAQLKGRHEIVIASRNSGDHKVDIADVNSINALYKAVGKVDAVACAAGNVAFAPLDQLTADKFEVGLRDKLMGQVNLVMVGRDYVNPGGSFTLISGILAEDPIVAGASASLVNAAVNGFVMAAAIELTNQRINVVSPTVFEESMAGYGPFFRGFEAVPVERAALAFSKSIEGAQTGQIYRVV